MQNIGADSEKGEIAVTVLVMRCFSVLPGVPRACAVFRDLAEVSKFNIWVKLKFSQSTAKLTTCFPLPRPTDFFRIKVLKRTETGTILPTSTHIKAPPILNKLTFFHEAAAISGRI